MEEFKELLNSIDIIQILEDEYGLQFKGSDRNWFMTSCPLNIHDDVNPSFGINTVDGYYNCLSCGSSGNYINLIENIENITFKEAIRKLFSMAGIKAISDENYEFKFKKNKQILNSNLITENFFPNNLDRNSFEYILSDKIRRIEKKHNFSNKCIKISDTIYKKIDDLIENEQYEDIKKIWKNIEKYYE